MFNASGRVMSERSGTGRGLSCDGFGVVVLDAEQVGEAGEDLLCAEGFGDEPVETCVDVSLVFVFEGGGGDGHQF